MPPSPYRRSAPTARRLWKRAAAVAKDKSSICLARSRLGRRWHRGNGVARNPELEAAIIKATSHDDSRIDYKNVGRVLSWVKISPSTMGLLMWFLSRRVERTGDWVVALKGLMLAHTVLLCSQRTRTKPVGPLPFDLSAFRDRSSWGFTTFVRAYFTFLCHRWTFPPPTEEGDGGKHPSLGRLWRMQDLLDLLMQIRPYGDGMELPLVLEAMDCVLIEIFDVYGRICRGVAQALIDIFGSSSSTCSYPTRRRGVSILRRATEQSTRLSAYFDVCRSVGLINASQLPAVETIPEEDVRDLETLIMENVDGMDEDSAAAAVAAVAEEFGGRVGEEVVDDKDEEGCGSTTTAATSEWIVFVDKLMARKGEEGRSGGGGAGDNNPFLRSTPPPQPYPLLRSRAVGGEPYSIMGRPSDDLLAN